MSTTSGNRIEFCTVEAFARFTAELQRQGIAYRGGELSSGLFFVSITGY